MSTTALNSTMDQTPVQPHGIGERLHARAMPVALPAVVALACVVLEEASARGGTIDTAKFPQTLAFTSRLTGIDFSKYDMDEKLPALVSNGLVRKRYEHALFRDNLLAF